MPDRVSVVIPTFNSADYIGAALASVLAQDYRDLEVIVVDDASSDGTPAVVRATSDERVRLIELLRNEGAGAARNAGITAATGRYIAFLDSDDLWLPGKLPGQIDFMRETGAACCYTRYRLMDDAGRDLGDGGALPPVLTYRTLLPHNRIRTSGFVYDARALGKVYFPLIRKRQDFGLFLQAVRLAGAARLYDRETAAYRLRRTSLSARKLGNLPYQWRFYRECLGFSQPRAARYLAEWGVRAAGVELRRLLLRSRAMATR